MGNEFHIKLNGYKIKHLFKNIRKLNGGKNLLAKKLGITPATLDDYLKSGQELLDNFDEDIQGYKTANNGGSSFVFTGDLSEGRPVRL